MKVGVSFISSDYSLEETIKKIEDSIADYIHVDMMDGNFVPTKNFEIADIKKMFKNTNKKLDVHLMVCSPNKYVRDLAKIPSVEYITIHYESHRRPIDVINMIKHTGKKIGIAINPETKVSHIVPLLSHVDQVLVMSVKPGKGGQKFMDSVLYKVETLKELRDENNYKYIINIDGGINADTISLAKESGVDARIIIAMIAQENPNMKDQTSQGTYGPMCVTSIHDGETLNYGYYDENGNFATKKITIEIDNLKNNNLYENGKYGDITVADAYCILYGVAILKDNNYQLEKSLTNLSPEDIVPLSIASYNQGYPDVIKMTKSYDNLFDAAYAIRYTYASKDTTDDDRYIEHVFNKIPDEELDKPFTFLDNNGNLITFSLEKNDELSTVSSEETKNYTL
jgi:ribulose-phosphate 3-epimerase